MVSKGTIVKWYLDEFNSAKTINLIKTRQLLCSPIFLKSVITDQVPLHISKPKVH